MASGGVRKRVPKWRVRRDSNSWRPDRQSSEGGASATEAPSRNPSISVRSRRTPSFRFEQHVHVGCQAVQNLAELFSDFFGDAGPRALPFSTGLGHSAGSHDVAGVAKSPDFARAAESSFGLQSSLAAPAAARGSHQLSKGSARPTSSAIRNATSSTTSQAVYSIEAPGSVGPPVMVMMRRIICRSSQP